uniref:Uncharacterized protein n=1 Tax=Lepeophtheirus salmonis TaxID=72036 RepID=A0A0K2TKF8_LEPSM
MCPIQLLHKLSSQEKRNDAVDTPKQQSILEGQTILPLCEWSMTLTCSIVLSNVDISIENLARRTETTLGKPLHGLGIYCSGLWSVSILKLQPIKYLSNFFNL